MVSRYKAYRALGALISAGVLLSLVAIRAHSQQDLGITMSKVMTKDQLRETGIASLSPAQRAALDSWLTRYTTLVLRYAAEKGTSAQTSGGSKDCTPAVETNIAGDFNGWDGDTVFKLSNGEIWEQAEYEYMYSYSFMPGVTIYATQSGCEMKVEGEDEGILVKRIK